MRHWSHLWAGMALSAAGLLVPLSQAPQTMASPKVPACHSAQMKVTLGSTKEVRAHKSVQWLGWVRYTNEGSTCLMSKTDVGVQAVTGKTHTPLGQGSVSDAVGRMPFVLHPHGSARALVELIETHSGPVYSCVPVPIDAIEITGYLDGWPKHYFSVMRERELAECNGDHIAAVGGVLSPV